MTHLTHAAHRTAALSKPILARAAIVAALLGSILTLLNQPDAIFGDAEIGWLSLILVYLTPFLVVSVSQVLGIRAAGAARPRVKQSRESFFATVFSHGIPMRAVVLSLAAGGISTAIVATDSLLAGHGLDQLPVASILQALILPAVFGALSQAVSFRRAVGQITSHARVNTGSRLLSAQRGASCGKVNWKGLVGHVRRL